MAMPSWLRRFSGTFPVTATSQRLMNIEATELTSGFSPAAIRRSMPRKIRLGGGHVLLAGEQQGHVDRHAREDGFLDGGQALLGTRYLDEEIRASRLGMEGLGRGDGAGRVVGQQGRDLQRHPAVHAVGLVVDRPEQIGGLPQVLQPQLEEQRLARLAFLQFLADGVVVVVAILDGVVEDRGVRGEPRDRELLNVAVERAARSADRG